MKVELHPAFKKYYKKRISNNPKLVAKTASRLKIFRENPANPILNDHSLKGSKNKFRSFYVSGDIRIIYMRVSEKHVILLDIGTHNQVY